MINPIEQQVRCNDTTSNKYQHIDTNKVVSILESHGLSKRSEVITHTRSTSRNGFQKHMIRMNETIHGKQESFPELVVVNSHDGLSSLKLMLGIYRMVCANGLIMGKSIFPTIYIKHLGDPYKELEKALPYVANKFNEVTDLIERWKHIELNQNQIQALAIDGASLRIKTPNVTINSLQISKPRRYEDQDNTLWNVFNRVQERVIGGGIKYQTTKIDKHSGLSYIDRNTTRRVKSIDEIARLNQGLSNIASQYAS